MCVCIWAKNQRDSRTRMLFSLWECVCEREDYVHYVCSNEAWRRWSFELTTTNLGCCHRSPLFAAVAAGSSSRTCAVSISDWHTKLVCMCKRETQELGSRLDILFLCMCTSVCVHFLYSRHTQKPRVCRNEQHKSACVRRTFGEF